MLRLLGLQDRPLIGVVVGGAIGILGVATDRLPLAVVGGVVCAVSLIRTVAGVLGGRGHR